MKIVKLLVISTLVAAVAALSGCASTTPYMGLTSKAPARTVMAQMAQIKALDPIKACVKPYTRGKRIGLQPSIDNTGKTNSVADAGTGNFLTGSQTANFAIPMLKDELGVTVQNVNNVSAETIYRQYSTPAVAARRARKFDAATPDYILDVTPMSLDFVNTRNGSVMVKGIGFYSDMQQATISGGAKLIKGDGSQDILGYGGMKLSVFSTQNGLMLGRVFGSVLATGDVGVGMQQPMQLWNGEYVVNITTLEAITNLPGMPARCGQMLKKIVGPDVVNI